MLSLDDRRRAIRSGVIVERGHQHGLALGVAIATLALMTWGMGRPALWLDEAASVVATQRTWADLWALLGGPDAPLVPYYALLKATSSAVTALVPAWAASPEALVRWPSVAVTVLAMWALTLWLARRCPPALAVSTAALLLATASFSRYAQEARPYAFVLAGAVVATILWTRLSRDKRRRWVVLYALALALLVAAHLFAASLVFAHLVAAVLTSDRPSRRSVLWRTSIAAALGMLLVSPLAATVVLRGKGPRLPRSLPTWVPPGLIDTLTVGGVLALGLGAAAALAVAVAWTAPARYRSVARLAAAWAVVPAAVLLPLMLVRPNLMMSRYVLFVLPAWAILGGVGLLTGLDLVRRGLAGFANRVRPADTPVRGSLVVAASYGVGVLALVGIVASQVDAIRAVRTPGGHGEDIRPALAAAVRPEYAQLPIVVSPPSNSLQIAAYARAEEDRLAGVHVQRDQPTIWSTVDPYRDRKDQLKQQERVVLLLKAARTGDCRWSRQRSATTKVRRCLPKPFQDKGYQVELAEAAGRGWTFVVLRHDPKACGPARCEP